MTQHLQPDHPWASATRSHAFGKSGRMAKVLLGVVYAVKPDYGPIRIGRTNALKNRLANLGQLVPNGTRLIACIPATNTKRTEAELHLRFRDFRLNGEWFNADEATVIEAFSRLEKEAMTDG